MSSFASGVWQVFWREELPCLLVAAALVAPVLAYTPKSGRRTLVHTLALLAASLAAELAGAMLEVGGAARAGAIIRHAAIVATGLAVIRLAGLTLFRAALPALGVTPPRIAEDIALVAAYIAWGMLQLRLAGMDFASLVTTSAVITAVAAFAMQDTLGNVLGGLFIELDGSIAIGDWVRLDDLSGRVADVRWRHTAIRTRNGETVIVPNSTLMKSRFAVIGNPDLEPVSWRRWVWFEVDSRVPAARVVAAVRQALDGAEIANVAREPEPGCLLMEFGAGHCRYALRYWLTDPLPDEATDAAVRVHLLAALERAGIQLALPEYVMHRIEEGEARDATIRQREIEARMAALRSVEIFSRLSEEELRMLSDHLVPAPFAPGDVMTRQGAVAHWLYILVEGEAEVWIDTPGAARRRVAVLGASDVFGEMGMMAGEPRSATVTAKTDVRCYRLDKAGFEGIIRSRPAIAIEISHVLAARADGLRQAAEEARAEAAVARMQQESVLGRIRAFFRLEPPAPGGAA